MTSDSTAPALRFEGVSKTFGATRALRDVSFDIRAGAVHALCGGNGSGKSTLLKVLAGVYQADDGLIHVHGEQHAAARTSPTWARDSGLHFVHQAVGTFADLSVAENFALGSTYGSPMLMPVPWRRLRKRVQDVLDRFELNVDADTRMGDLRPATQTMVAVARALQNEQEHGRGVLVLDEPTASLPVHEADLVLDAIRGYSARGHTVVFVTHRLPEILSVATHATFLRDGAHLETRSTEGMTQRDLIERIAGHAVTADHAAGAPAPGPALLQLRDHAVGPVDKATLDVAAGEVVGISGLLGSGRSALLQSIFGARPARGGQVLLDGEVHAPRSPRAAIRAGVAYLPEDRPVEGAFNELSIRHNLSAPAMHRYWNRVRLRRGAEAAAARDAISTYGVVTSSPEAPVSSMSGGNQQKVILARWLELAPRVLLLDEPSQGVDVGARTAIHGLVRKAAAKGMAVLVVSSDPEELVELCDRVVGLHKGRIVGEARGAELTVSRCIELAYGTPTTDGAHSTPTPSATQEAAPQTKEVPA